MKIKFLFLFSLVSINIFAQFSYSPPPVVFHNFSYNQDQKYGCIAYMENGEKLAGDSYLHTNLKKFGMDYLLIDGQKITPAFTCLIAGGISSMIGWIVRLNKKHSLSKAVIIYNNKK